MWKAVTEFYLQIHAQGLSHEAVIEIMIALLGVMLTIVALAVALLGLYGYAAIKQAAVRKAKQESRRVALQVSEEFYERLFARVVAADYTESQESSMAPHKKVAPAESRSTLPKQGRRPATNDANLRHGGTDDDI